MPKIKAKKAKPNYVVCFSLWASDCYEDDVNFIQEELFDNKKETLKFAQKIDEAYRLQEKSDRDRSGISEQERKELEEIEEELIDKYGEDIENERGLRNGTQDIHVVSVAIIFKRFEEYVAKPWMKGYENVELPGDKVWQVDSSSGNGKYEVLLRNGEYSCECEGYFRRDKCRHIDLIAKKK